jgi:hypothetical protein
VVIKRCPGTSSEGTTHHTDKFALSLGLSCVRAHAGMSPRTATPVTEVQYKDYRNVLDGKVLHKMLVLDVAPA